MTRLLALVLLVCSSQYLIAQETLNELTVDRPGIADAPFTVSPGDYQFETGFEYYNRTPGKLFLLPVILARTGLSEASELRITIKQISERSFIDRINGISPLTLGIKTHIIKQDGWIPETDILANLTLPIGNSRLQPQEVGHDIFLLFQNDLNQKLAANYNLGLIWDGNSAKSLFTGSFCINYLPTSRLGFFAEYFNFIRQSSEEHGFDMGLTYLIRRFLQADLSGGISRQIMKTNFFVSCGLSFRVTSKATNDM